MAPWSRVLIENWYSYSARNPPSFTRTKGSLQCSQPFTVGLESLTATLHKGSLLWNITSCSPLKVKFPRNLSWFPNKYTALYRRREHSSACHWFIFWVNVSIPDPHALLGGNSDCSIHLMEFFCYAINPNCEM